MCATPLIFRKNGVLDPAEIVERGRWVALKKVRSRTDVERLLAKHAFLSGAKASLAELLSTCANIQEFGPGRQLFCEGGDADQFFLIVEGAVVLEAPGRGTETVQSVRAGQALGWSWLFPPHHWRFSATAVERTRAIVLEGNSLRQLARKNRDFCYWVAWLLPWAC